RTVWEDDQVDLLWQLFGDAYTRSRGGRGSGEDGGDGGETPSGTGAPTEPRTPPTGRGQSAG
ncbi:MAG TPA: hypothetical protein VLT16_01230, partial [Candidatus Limnocylindrales bacterium]|nr:hypothetical protein [Candidatus Limnocylindrales bacterium]